MTQYDKILDKVQKLKAHAESAEAIGNEAEAQAFAAMFQQLMLKHKISMTDVEFKQLEEEEPVDRHYIDYNRYPDLKMRKSRIQWIERLAGVIAQAHMCRILVHPGSSRITLVGRKSDTTVAEFMIITLQRTVEKLAKDEHSRYCWEVYKRDGNCRAAQGFKESFIKAFVMRLAQRYDDELNASAGANTTALVRVRKEEKAVEDWMSENVKKKATSITRATNWNREGVRRGTQAANNINLKPTVLEGEATGRKALR